MKDSVNPDLSERLHGVRELAAKFNATLTDAITDRATGWYRLNVRLIAGTPAEVRLTAERHEDLRRLDGTT